MTGGREANGEHKYIWVVWSKEVIWVLCSGKVDAAAAGEMCDGKGSASLAMRSALEDKY